MSRLSNLFTTALNVFSPPDWNAELQRTVQAGVLEDVKRVRNWGKFSDQALGAALEIAGTNGADEIASFLIEKEGTPSVMAFAAALSGARENNHSETEALLLQRYKDIHGDTIGSMDDLRFAGDLVEYKNPMLADAARLATPAQPHRG